MRELKEALQAESLEPGELERSLEEALERDGPEAVGESLVTDLETQREVAEKRLDHYLENLSDAPGARKVLRKYFRDEFGEKIDPSDPSDLKEHVRSVDDILKRGSLPTLSKDELRDKYGVEGAWGEEDEQGDEIPYLAPDWIKENPEEPKLTIYTTGTTGQRWGRVVTRNDWAEIMSHSIAGMYEIFSRNDIDPSATKAAVLGHPEHMLSEMITEILDKLDSNPKYLDIRKAEDRPTEIMEEMEYHLEGDQPSVFLGPISPILDSPLGQNISKAEMDLDLCINGGHTFKPEHRELLEAADVGTANIYGETEYPQGGALQEKIGSVEGFRLPLDAQINVVMEDGEISMDGRGEFGYLPFGIEGYAVPGIYQGGVEATLNIVEEEGDKYQVLTNPVRTTEPARETPEWE